MKLCKSIAIASAVLLCASCDETIRIGSLDEGMYANVNACVGYMIDKSTGKSENVIELWKEDYESDIQIALSKTPKKGVELRLEYDPGYAEKYNSMHSTDFPVLPEDLISIDNEGRIVMAPDDKNSYSLGVNISYSDELEDGKTYVVPIRIVSESDGITIPENTSHGIYLVKNYHNENNADKGSDKPKIFLYTGCNPYNLHEFKLENGKYLFDVVCLFAANINYNAEEGHLYINRNENVQYWLDHADTYIRPLQKHGVKVILGLLCNWDWSCLASLSEYGAQVFAKQLKDICDTYGLDGVNFDDEYEQGTPEDPDNPLYGGHSEENGARLCYETKKAMPDKLVTVYDLQAMYGVSEVEGVDASEWIDIVVADYGRKAYPVGNMTLKDCSGISIEMARSPHADERSLNEMMMEGYGWVMMFDLYANGRESVYKSQISACQTVAKTLYEVEMPTPKNYWKLYEENPEAWGNW